jgi:hypothetical protein
MGNTARENCLEARGEGSVVMVFVQNTPRERGVQGGSDALIKSLRDSNLVASKEEAAAAEVATVREHQMAAQQEGPQKCPVRCIEVFDVGFGQSINLSQWDSSKVAAWLCIFFGVSTILGSLLAARFEGNAENFNKVEPWRPKIWERVCGVIFGFAFLTWGIVSLWRAGGAFQVFK